MSNYSKSTNKYLKDNSEILNMKINLLVNNSNKRKVNMVKITTILQNIIYDSTIGIIRYFKEIFNNIRYISNLTILKDGKKDKKAIVIGNGPSQGFIDAISLQKFINNGNDIFVVNFWHQNNELSHIIPNYIVISDPNTLKNDIDQSDLSEYLKDQNKQLLNYLIKNKSIKIIAPLSRRNSLTKLIDENRFIFFVDTELRWITSNIDPRFPRGYVSMTLYKALAMALHFGYFKIYVIGMDNTYCKDNYCDKNNRILRKETHVAYGDFVVDMTELIPSMDVLFQDIFNLFYDLRRCFDRKNIINLDCFSLTDVFQKIENLDKIKSELIK